jgi:TatA/E family protein of Tat protein translocase
VFLLILESLGSTELLFILVMALVFFGPRKLPQISRSLGKSLAEFRRASDDFKRTWEREVAMENPLNDAQVTTSSPEEVRSEPFADPHVEAIPTEQAIPRQSASLEPETIETSNELESPEPSRKRDWL